MESSDVVIIEKSDSEENIQKSVRAQFAHVVFYNVEESYQENLDVNCAYRISAELEVNSRDWVGLFKVGWRSQSNYVCYEWSPMPKDYVKGSEVENLVVFAAYRLPRDDGEFYQFCYITWDGQVRGASTPFQFRLPSPSDLMEVEEENGELLVIKTKTAVLEEQLKKANETRLQMKQEMLLLQNDLDLMRQTEYVLQKKLILQKNDSETLKNRIQETSEEVAKQKEMVKQRDDQLEFTLRALDLLEKKSKSAEEKLAANDNLIASLEKKIKTLNNEKDSVVGQNKALEREKEMYMSCFHESEMLRKNLGEMEAHFSQMKAETEKMKEELKNQRSFIDMQTVNSVTDKETIDDISERLRNAEDRLQAAEACKMMLNEEVLSMKQAYEQISLDFQRSQEEIAHGKHVLLQRDKELNESVELLRKEKEQIELELAEKCKSLDDLEQATAEQAAASSEEMAHLKQEAEGSLYALQLAHDTLSDRFNRLQKRNESIQRTLEQTQMQMKELQGANEDQVQEIRSLRERLIMGQEAYKEKFVECQKLEVQLAKYRDRVPMQNQTMQTSFCVSDELTSPELQQQLRDVAAELDNRQEKIRKYKSRLMLEKAANGHYAKSLADAEAEIKRLKAIHKAHTRSEEVFDPLESDDSKGIPLHAPLKPLPAPMEPKKLSSPVPVLLQPKKLNSQNGPLHDQDIGLNGIKSLVESLYQFAPDSFMDQANGQTVEEERFVDAPEEPFHLSTTFRNPVISSDGRVGVIPIDHSASISPASLDDDDTDCRRCPICFEKFNNDVLNIDFVGHVNEHFDDA